MAGHTYRYFQGEPLYPFGYGLSYTSFEYGDLTVSEGNTTDQAVSVLVKVTNTGKVAGEEVVQVYLSNLSTQLPTPAHSLQGFERVESGAGRV